MNAHDLLTLVWSNLRRMKTRVAMTAIGVVIGTAAVIVLVSLAAGLQRTAAQDLGSNRDLTIITVLPGAFIRNFGGSSSGRADEEAVLNDRALNELRDLPGVVAVTPHERLMGSGMLRANRLVSNVQVVGIDPSTVDKLGLSLATGSGRLGRWQAVSGGRVKDQFFDPQTQRAAEESQDLQGQALQLILSKASAEDGSPVERVVRVRVSGVLGESGGQDDYTFFLALNDVTEMNSWLVGHRLNPGREGYSQALIKVATSEQVLAVEQEVLSRGFYAYSPRSMLQQMNVFFLVIQGVFGGIGAIALIVAAFGIANTMTMAIYERTREIGLMKAIGATNRDVMSVFLAEAGGIGLLGGLGGVTLGVALGALIDLIASTYLAAQAVQSGAAASDLDFTLVYTPPWLLVFAFLFAGIVGVVSGIYPAMRAAALSPVAALKYE